MKNIHLLPTEKPSRLTKINDELFFGKNEREMLSEPSLNIVAQHIYITSDEEIKKGDWYLDDTLQLRKALLKEKDWQNNGKLGFIACKKIILTTDQDLIADGVQAIDDEFLEWFVKNPSCESVEVEDFPTIEKYNSKGEYIHNSNWIYKIIIPQEEPKRKIDTCYNFDMEIGCVQDICRCEQEEPKQETLTYTEAAKKEERIFNSTMMSKQETLKEAAANLADPNLCKTDNWIAGAKYMAEKMYTYDELRTIAYNAYCLGQFDSPTEGKFNEWIQQFKKEAK